VRGVPNNYPLFRGVVASPCELSRKICHFYEVLTQSQIQRSKYSLSDKELSLRSPFSTPQLRLQNHRSDFPVFSPSGGATYVPSWSASSPAEKLVLAMVSENFRIQDIECMPFGIALPLREALRSCRHTPPGRLLATRSL